MRLRTYSDHLRSGYVYLSIAYFPVFRSQLMDSNTILYKNKPLSCSIFGSNQISVHMILNLYHYQRLQIDILENSHFVFQSIRYRYHVHFCYHHNHIVTAQLNTFVVSFHNLPMDVST